MSTSTLPVQQPPPQQEKRAPSPALKPSFWHKLPAVLLVLGFLVVLVLPLATTDFPTTPTISACEKRTLKPFPEWSWQRKALKAFPTRFENAFNDHFGFRNPLVRLHSRIKIFCFGVSPVRDMVMGKEGWLYLSESIKDYPGKKNLSKKDVEQWVRDLKTKQAWLAARNIRYMLVVAPNKEDVYPEYLPDTVRQIRDHRFIDDIVAGLGANSGVEVLDLRDALRKGKTLGLGLVYDRTDTHWSQLGAFLATNEILLRLQSSFPELQPTPLESRTLSHQIGNGGDLAGMTNLNDLLLEDRVRISPSNSFHPASLQLQIEWPRGAIKVPPMIFESNNTKLAHSVLVTGDSFGVGLMDFLPEHFQKIVRLHPEVPYTPWFRALIPKLLETEKADIYLEIFCARNMKRIPNTTPAPEE